MPRHEYITVDLQEALDNAEYVHDTWHRRLASLKSNEAGKVSGLGRIAARHLRNSILGSLRASRTNLKAHTKVVQDGELFTVYFWRNNALLQIPAWQMLRHFFWEGWLGMPACRYE